jgi:hypothetical protein
MSVGFYIMFIGLLTRRYIEQTSINQLTVPRPSTQNTLPVFSITNALPAGITGCPRLCS